jgi:uncharacterized repeat protein (TIGR03803 family)
MIGANTPLPSRAMQNPRQGRTIQRSSYSICLLAFVSLALLSGGLGRGQGISNLGSFDNSLGAAPTAYMKGTDGNLYGTTTTGGLGGGVIYEVLTDGSPFAPQGSVVVLHYFGDGSVSNDGANPTAGLIQVPSAQSDSLVFYGTTSSGGSAGKGTVYEFSPNGVTVLHSFGDGSVTNDGAVPYSSLILGTDGNLYGTTSQGGSAGKGTVFEITQQGAVTILHSFGDGSVVNDGSSPKVGLAQDAQGNLYGTTPSGGASNLGAVFKIDAQRHASVIYSFAHSTTVSFQAGIPANTQGGYLPNSRLLIGTDGNLYGTTQLSDFGYGTVFQVTPQGAEKVLHYFGDGSVANDGREVEPVHLSLQNPQSSGSWEYANLENVENTLTQATDGNFYGTTDAGGLFGSGTMFEITPAGVVTILNSFGNPAGVVNGPNGTIPLSGVVQGNDGSFYGATCFGGNQGLTIYTPPLVGVTGGTIQINTGTTGSSGAEYGVIFKLDPSLPLITSSLNIYGGIGLNLSYQITATQSPTSYNAIGLQDGLTINNSTGAISGLPTTLGTFNITIGASNAAGNSNNATLVVTIQSPPVITSILSEVGSTTTTFGYQIQATNGPNTFDATGLPAGLFIDKTTGIISGTPTQTGAFAVTISAINAASQDNQTLKLVIRGTAPTPSQEYVPIRSFGDGTVSGEGNYPGSFVQGKDGIFYGVTSQGGADNAGTVFSLSPAGNATLVSNLGGAIGAAPQGLVQGADGSFYGTTQNGGSAGKGTLFKVTPAGVVTLLHTFGVGTVTDLNGTTTTDGANPQGGVILSLDGDFYGTTQYGGQHGQGTIFRMSPGGTVTILYSFGAFVGDGEQPVAALVENGEETFYGTTQAGGTAGDGTAFVIYPAGNESTLHSFGDGKVTNDGQMPHSALANFGGTFYGTTFIGGTLGKGTLFELQQNGTVTILHNFADGSVANDGINPIGDLVAFNLPTQGMGLYGTTQNGGANGGGAAFEWTAAATTILHSFDDPTLNSDGITPMGGLVLASDGNLYGTTMAGGDGSGTAFALLTNLTPPGQTTFPPSYWTLTGTLPPGMNFDSTSGTISGTPLAADPFGIYSISITHVTNGIAAQPQSVTINLGETFATWASTHTLVGGSQTGTPSDGVSLLLKFLCDIDPNAPITASDRIALPTLGSEELNGSTSLTLTYRQYAGASSLSVTLQSSSDLATWSDVPPANLLSQQLSTLTNGDAIMEKGMKVTGPGRQFLRLNVISP